MCQWACGSVGRYNFTWLILTLPYAKNDMVKKSASPWLPLALMIPQENLVFAKLDLSWADLDERGGEEMSSPAKSPRAQTESSLTRGKEMMVW